MDDKGKLESTLSLKFDMLRDNLKRYERVAVAFSGGIDSTVLLHNVCEIFPQDRVTAVHIRSCLLSEDAGRQALEVYSQHFERKCTFEYVEADPLGWQGFEENSAERCYICKKNMYMVLLSHIQPKKHEALLDGTNVDDLDCVRPGFRAVRELGVQTPLADALLTKGEIRDYGRIFGLINAEAPSNSCLATRLQEGVHIRLELLKKVECAEIVLGSLGMKGCRVRITGTHTVIELSEKDIERCASVEFRSNILEQFKSIGLYSICLSLRGR